ncbi:MAG: exopolyphosphatase [Planctomycetota bacterium]
MSPKQRAIAVPDRIAAVDLGSNSFHLVIARVVDGQPEVVDRRREMVQLALGLDEDGGLSRGARDRALACLQRFAQRLRGMPPAAVRAVGTNTLRAARRARDFRREAEEALGHRIEVVSGREEARLIYLGVAHTLADDEGQRLVIDIGGGSTELILGERFEAREVESLYMGCVSFSLRFFPEGRISPAGWDRCVLAAQQELQTIAKAFHARRWSSAVGASGTIRTTEAVLSGLDLGKDTITRKALETLVAEVLRHKHTRKLAYAGLKPERRAVFPGGLAILLALFDALGLDKLDTSTGALREGLLFDLLGRASHEDVRERTIEAFLARFRADEAQARRVEQTALELYDASDTEAVVNQADARDYLSWAARLHEVGHAISFRHYHKHGAYLVDNSDLPGFSRDEQALLAFLVHAQRRRFPDELLEPLRPKVAEDAVRLAILLRLAVLLNRSHDPIALPGLRAVWKGRRLQLAIPRQWWEAHRLADADLEEEARLIDRAGPAFALELVRSRDREDAPGDETVARRGLANRAKRS